MHTEYQLYARYWGPGASIAIISYNPLHDSVGLNFLDEVTQRIIKWPNVAHQGSETAGIQTNWVWRQSVKSLAP